MPGAALSVVDGGGVPDGARPRSYRRLLVDFAAFAGARRIALAAGLILAGAAFEGVGILLLVPLLQTIIEPGGAAAARLAALAGGFVGPVNGNGLMLALFAGFGALMLVRGAVLTVRDTHLARLRHGYIEATKQRLFERLAAASWQGVARLDRARIVKALGSDMAQVALAVHFGLQAALGVALLAAYGLFALLLAPQLALLTFAFLGVVALGGGALLGHAARHGEALVRQDLSMTESALRFLAGLKLAMAQDLQAGFVATYARASEAALHSRVEFVRLMSVARNLSAVFAALAAGLAVLAGLTVLEVAPATLIAFVVLLSRTTAPAALVQQGVQQLAHSRPAFDELNALGGELERSGLPAAPAPVSANASQGPCALSFEAVSFRYPGEGGRGALSLEIEPGTLVGLAGHSGSGKSTLLDLAAGLIDPDAGTIRLDGRALASDLAGYRRRLAYLGADAALFGDSVRNNLLWAAPGADDDALWEALRLADAEALVRRLGQGLDSRLADAGANLSAGERQRIALARALLRRPGLLLLDEATGSLAAASERRVLGHIRALTPAPTVLMVSHRAESLALCDRVLTLAEGALVGDTGLQRIAV